MPEYNLAFLYPFGTGCTDIILIQYFEHTCPGIFHIRSQEAKRQNRYGQHKVHK
ncbi:hypothetical protein D3C73_1648140 [compost metagenome]